MSNGDRETIRVSLNREAARDRLGDTGMRDVRETPFLDLEDEGLEVQITKKQIEAIVAERIDSVAAVYKTLDVVKKDLKDFFPKVPEILPSTLDGRLLNPDGTPAEFVLVQALAPPPVGSGTTKLERAWPRPETNTDRRGAFRLTLPPRPVPDDGLKLLVTGGNRATEIVVRRTDLVASNGSLGVVPLDVEISPMPRSVVSQLADVVLPTSEEDVLANPTEFASPAPILTLGEGDCARSFRSNLGTIDRFGYSMLVRLIAPQLSGRRLGTRIKRQNKSFLLSPTSAGLSMYLGADQIVEAMASLGSWELVERVPVEAPIDVTQFRDAIERNPKLVPKAASLGIGYLVRMHQIWIPAGLSLGDLVYSLPLAPGEQQRIAISDERETLSVREAETLTAEEFQRYRETADSSTNAVFTSAFDESASGGSRMQTRTEAGSIGGGLGVAGVFGSVVAGLGIAGGYSDSSTSGSTSSWQKASRDYVSNASQDFHSNLSREAAARRRASRTSVRLATATERREIVTKVITNHNHNHALTMQYWEVLRHFAVSSRVDDVQLVCFVPLEVVQFLPAGQPRMLPTGDYSRDQLLYRYGLLLRYYDVLERRIWWRPELMHGLRVLRAFAGNPTMTVQSSTGTAQDIIDVSIEGTFMPFEEIDVTAVSTTGARVGPVRLDGSASAAIAPGIETRAGLLERLRKRRRDEFETRTASIVLPDYVARSDLARLEFTRRFSTFSYRLSLPSSLSFTDILGYLSNMTSLDVTLTPTQLEQEIGGPIVRNPDAKIGSTDVIEAYLGPDGTERMGGVLPVAAKRLPPMLAFADLLRIEAVLNHVVQNTVPYSKAVWESLTPEERAIMLERFTIGVPSGGVSDPSDEVPLLNCVANVVVGYFGNAAIMPFFIPANLAGEMKVTSRDVQEALLKFHRQAFVPPQSSITLPARGVLGEAVLGSCTSSEKIDLTRFWNWQDSPPDVATDPAALAQLFADQNALVGAGGATAPSGLTTGPMVTINQGAAALTPADLASALIAKLPQTNLPQDLTGLKELAGQMKVQTETTAESLNKTIGEASGLAKAAMEALPNAIKAKKGEGTPGAGGTGAGGAGGTGGAGGGTTGTGGTSGTPGTGGTGGTDAGPAPP